MNKNRYIKQLGLNSFLITFFVFFMPLFSFGLTAVPGIDIDKYGVTTWTSNSSDPYTSLDVWINIVDHDGIADDGSSHIVTVTYPDGTVRRMTFLHKENDDTAAYGFFDNTIFQPIDAVAYSGNYVFKVCKVGGDCSEVIDHVVVNPINPPDETTFLPNFETTATLTAYFDNVVVNGVLFDDFNSGEFDPAKWSWQPYEVTYTNGEACFEKTYDTPSGSVWLSLKNEAFLNEFKATVRADTILGTSSRARIMGNFWQENGDNVYCQIRIQENNVTYSIGKDILVDGHMASAAIADSTVLGPISQGNNYELSMQWDGSTVTFHVLGLDDGVDYTDTYSPQGTIGLPSDPGAMIGIARHLMLDTTTPSLSWDAVPGSEFYRVRVYAHDANWNIFTVYNGYTGTTAFTLPPGILKPNGYYKYRVQSYRDHQWMEIDNTAGSDRDKQFIIAGPEEAQDPYVDLHSIGVETWTTDTPAGTFTDFYIKIHDAQGVPGNIESVNVLFPDGITAQTLYLDYNDSDTCGRYRANYWGAIQSGEYTFTVVDKDGNSHSMTETLSSNPIDPPLEASFLPVNNTVVWDTEVSFDWYDVPGAALYQLKIYNKDLDLLFDLYTIESEYILPKGLLEENSLYRYLVHAKKEFYEDNSDNGASTPTSVWEANTFLTSEIYGEALPALNLASFGVAVFQAPHPETGYPVYALDFFAMVTDSDGVPENIARVEVTYPDETTTILLNYMDVPDWGSNYYAVESYADPYLIQDTSNSSGIYTFTVVDADGNEVTLTDTLTYVSGNVLSWPTNLSPANDTVLSNTTPQITWDPVSGASYYKVRILKSWGASTVHWSSELTQNQYIVPGGVLEPDKVYGYRVYAYRDAIGSEIDFYSGSSYWHSANNHFTVTNGLSDSVFDKITLNDIQSSNLFSKKIDGSNNASNKIPVGTDLAYQTNEGRYGKMEIQDYASDLIIEWVTYNSDGSIFKSGDNLTINSTWHYDMDFGIGQASFFESSDFWWKKIDGITKYIVPENNARFALYSANSPNRPNLVSPSTGALDVSLTPTLTTQMFSDPDAWDIHFKTDWQISTVEDFSTTVLYKKSTVYLTSLPVPVLALYENTRYYWRVRFYDNNLNVSEWSDIFSFTTLQTQDDTNENGIPDTLESETIDLDNDGTVDIEQINEIKSLNTVLGDGQMGVSIRESDTVTETVAINSIDPNTISTVIRPNDMPLGLFSCRLRVISPGDIAHVKIYFSKAAPANAIWYFHDSINGWTDYSDHATFSNDRKSVDLELKDGDYGDADGVANGIIVDPCGYGIASWIQGAVSDSSTGKNISTATISFENMNITLNTVLDGHYLCMLLPGMYTFSVSAPGYEPESISNLEIAEGSIVIKDIELLVTPPSKVVLASPSGTINDTTPTITWTEDPTSTWYKLWIGYDNGGRIFSQWYESADICSGGICSVTLESELTSDSYEFWVKSWNDGGSVWSDGMAFAVQNLPSKVTHSSPSGTLQNSTPTYTWNEDPASTWYKLWIGYDSGERIFAQWYEAVDVCSEGICSVTLASELANGSYGWWIKSWNDHGRVWSDGMSFTVSD